MARAIGVTAAISYKVDPSATVYVTVPLCTVVATPKVSVSKIDTTNLGITNNVMTSVPGMADPGTLEFSFQFDAAVYEALSDIHNSIDVIQWRIASPTGHGATWDFSGYIVDLDEPFESNTLNVTKVTLQISGAVVLTVV